MNSDLSSFVKNTIILTRPTVNIFQGNHNFIFRPCMEIKIPCFKSLKILTSIFFRNNIQNVTIFTENLTTAKC